jgi:RHS repeat-associated protein
MQPIQGKEFSFFTSSLENDPQSIIENVSTIHGDYSKLETDLIVSGPDPIILYRFYSSRLHFAQAPLGGWQFLPHCFLYLKKENDVFIGSTKGGFHCFTSDTNSIPSNSPIQFKLCSYQNIGLVNTANGIIVSLTNLKNATLEFNQQNDTFEFDFNGIKRIYKKHKNLGYHLLEQEILPSGNKIFYDYDENDRLKKITLKNASENKTFSWISIKYESSICIETSDQTRVEYHFDDFLGKKLLKKVTRSFSYAKSYSYHIQGNQILLIKEECPNNRYTTIEYLNSPPYKVKNIFFPYGSNQIAKTQFSYQLQPNGSGSTEIIQSNGLKRMYQFNTRKELTGVQEYLQGSPYRTLKKIWGRDNDSRNLIAECLEDAQGNVFYYKSFKYDTHENILEEAEFGNLTGSNPSPIQLDENQNPLPCQEHHSKQYSYETSDEFEIIKQIDEKGTGLYSFYKKGTNLLFKQLIFKKQKIKKRSFYEYEDGSLVRIIEDNGDGLELNQYNRCNERHIVEITPKKTLPNAGAPEIIEEKYFDFSNSREGLKRKIINHFDSKGNVIAQVFFDSNNQYLYSIKKGYDEKSRLISETNPLGQMVKYFYDENDCIQSTEFEGIITEFEYDLQNLPIAIKKSSTDGKAYAIYYTYDNQGNKVSEINEYGRETIYEYDELNRLTSETHSPVPIDQSNQRPKFTYTYDLFDNPIILTNGSGKTKKISYTIRGNPVHIQYPDGTQEFYKYDPEGSLHRFSGKDGITHVYEYDYLGRLEHIEDYERENNGGEDGFSRIYKKYNAFHLISESKGRKYKNLKKYYYNYSGQMESIDQGGRKIEFIYDSLGRIYATKHWKSDTEFTLRVNKYDFLDRMIENRIENTKGNILVKKEYTYTPQGDLFQTIGYPNNQRSILEEYEYDLLGRVIKIKREAQSVTQIKYEIENDNNYSLKTNKQMIIDPLGNHTERFYDTKSQLLKIIQKDAKGTILREQNYTRNLDGNILIEKHLIQSPGKLAKTYDLHYAYNPKGFLESIRRGDEKQTLQESYIYDDYGNLTKTKFSGFKKPLKYKHNAKNNLEYLHFQSLEKRDRVHITYNLNSNITGLYQEGRDSISRGYNAWNELEYELFHFEFKADCVDLSYDQEGLIQKITLPDKSYIEYFYDGPYVKKITRFNPEGNELYTHHVVQRDLMGHIIDEILINHTTKRHHEYDSQGRKIQISTDFFVESIPSKGGFDLVGNILKKITTLKNQTINSQYTYDSLYQLTSEKHNHKLTAYAYDSLGNRIKINNQPYISNALNQITNTPEITLNYHDNGAVCSKKDQDKNFNYTFDQLGSLRLVQRTSDFSMVSNYDFFGRRAKTIIKDKNQEESFRRYFYLNDYELGALDEKRNIIELRIPLNPNAPHGSSIISMELYGKTLAPIQDLQGNIVCLVDPETKEIKESYNYSAFGEEAIFDSNGAEIKESRLGNAWQYQAKRIDQETGLIYFGNRYYDPKIGRWISPDPLGEIDSPNLYLFCHNNPLTYADHLGLSTDLRDQEFQKYFYGEYEPHCYCEAHRHCKRGGSIGEKWKGRIHGLIDVFYNIKEDWTSAFFNIGVQHLDVDFNERLQIIHHFERKQQQQTLEFENWIQNLLKVDPNDSDYFYNRLYTNIGIESVLLVGAGVGAIKGMLGVGKAKRALRKLSKTLIYEKHIFNIERKISSWLGKGTQFIRNNAGDPIFLSKDGLRKVRFDFKRPYPHESPHLHFEHLVKGEWEEISRIYPIDVPHK